MLHSGQAGMWQQEQRLGAQGWGLDSPQVKSVGSLLLTLGLVMWQLSALPFYVWNDLGMSQFSQLQYIHHHLQSSDDFQSERFVIWLMKTVMVSFWTCSQRYCYFNLLQIVSKSIDKTLQVEVGPLTWISWNTKTFVFLKLRIKAEIENTDVTSLKYFQSNKEKNTGNWEL